MTILSQSEPCRRRARIARSIVLYLASPLVAVVTTPARRSRAVERFTPKKESVAATVPEGSQPASPTGRSPFPFESVQPAIHTTEPLAAVAAVSDVQLTVVPLIVFTVNVAITLVEAAVAFTSS